MILIKIGVRTFIRKSYISFVKDFSFEEDSILGSDQKSRIYLFFSYFIYYPSVTIMLDL